jgi:hypothetical protein
MASTALDVGLEQHPAAAWSSYRWPPTSPGDQPRRGPVVGYGAVRPTRSRAASPAWRHAAAHGSLTVHGPWPGTSLTLASRSGSPEC